MKTVFITTKNIDYIRNTQEINLLRQAGHEVTIIGSGEKSYPRRLLYVYYRMAITSFKQFDTVFVGFAPQLVVPFWKWKWKKNRLTIDFFISLYDTLVFDRKKIREGGLPAKFLKCLDTLTVQAADTVISDTKAHGAYFVSEFGLRKDRLKVVYLEADRSVYYPMDVPKPLEYENVFIVLYFGSILPLQGIDIVLKSAEILRKEKGIHFYIIGPVKESEKFESDTVTYIPWLSQKELAEHIAMADLCLAGHFNRDIEKAKRTIPGKAYIYRAMNKPIVLGENPANHELYEETEKETYFVEMGNPKELAEVIVKAKRERAMHSQEAGNGKVPGMESSQ